MELSINTTLKVTSSGGKFWLTIGSITFGKPIDTREQAEQFKEWFKSAMPKVIDHIEDQQLKKEAGKWVKK